MIGRRGSGYYPVTFEFAVATAASLARVVFPTTLPGDGTVLVICQQSLDTANLEKIARERLSDSGYLALLDVTCEFSADVAHLRGRLPSQHLKQVAQAIITGLAGVRTVRNQIEVIKRSARRSRSQAFV
jgi:hypothetical protein